MGKSKRTMNPADALRKKQRKRELQKNKEDRKRVRESALAKKDIGKVRQDIARLEHLVRLGQLDKAGQARLEGLRAEATKIEKVKKATELTGAQAAYAARIQEHDKKHENDVRRLVYDPKRGAFVPAKKKESKKITTGDDEEDEDSSSDSSESDSDDSDSSMEDSDEEDDNEEEEEEEDVPMPKEQHKVLTESDDEYEIPLPPGPPPQRPFDNQLAPLQNRLPAPPPPPPGPPPFRGPYPVHQGQNRMQPPPPPPIPHGFVRPPVYNSRMQPPPPPPPTITYQRPPPSPAAFSAPVHYEAKPKAVEVAPTISAEPQLRDLQKELLGFVPAAIRRKQAKKLPKE